MKTNTITNGRVCTYTFTPALREAARDSLVIELRKYGFTAYREAGTIHTDATKARVNHIAGCHAVAHMLATLKKANGRDAYVTVLCFNGETATIVFLDKSNGDTATVSRHLLTFIN